MIEALQNCQDCRHGKSNLRGGGENTEEVVGKADARPRKSEYNDDTLASREQRQVNIHAEMAIRALPLAISLTTGVHSNAPLNYVGGMDRQMAPPILPIFDCQIPELPPTRIRDPGCQYAHARRD